MSLKQTIMDAAQGTRLSRLWRLYDRRTHTRSPLWRSVYTLRFARCAAKHGGYIGSTAVLLGKPVLPHGLHGVYISRFAQIGKNCWIYQNVTIGEVDGKAPVIGDDCLIGANAVLVGGIRVGNHVKIGAGAVVAADVPDNCTVVSPPARVIPHRQDRKDST